MNADAELKLSGLRPHCVGGGKLLLNGDRARDGIHHACELRENTVAGGIRDPPAMLQNQSVEDLAMRREGAQGPNLVLLHKARVAGHVGGEDGRQPPLNPPGPGLHGKPHRFLLGRLMLFRQIGKEGRRADRSRREAAASRAEKLLNPQSFASGGRKSTSCSAESCSTRGTSSRPCKASKSASSLRAGETQNRARAGASDLLK